MITIHAMSKSNNIGMHGREKFMYIQLYMALFPPSQDAFGFTVPPDSKVLVANMSAPDGRHVGPMNLAIRGNNAIRQGQIINVRAKKANQHNKHNARP